MPLIAIMNLDRENSTSVEVVQAFSFDRIYARIDRQFSEGWLELMIDNERQWF